METKKFEYLGNAITFARENGNVMINATEMARNFGAQPSDWTKLKSTQAYMQALSTVRKISVAEMIIIAQGGKSQQGTWMNEDVAMEFARWLSPAFAIWCNDRTKELLKYGATAINPEDLLNPDFIISLATQLKVERARIAMLESQNSDKEERLQLQERVIKESAPKVMYFDTVLQSETLITTNVIAKELGMSAVGLNRILHDKKIIYRSGETWVLYHEHQDKGYTGTKTHIYRDSYGNERTHVQTYWTEKGRMAIHRLFQHLKTA